MDIFRFVGSLTGIIPDGFTYKNILTGHGMITRRKGWEFQLAYTTLGHLLDFETSYTIKEDHAGFRIQVIVLGLFAEFQVYDSRHWDYKNNQWEDPSKD